MTGTVYVLSNSSRAGKKWQVHKEVNGRKSGTTVHFGATGYSDYTKHKDADRKKNYESRHRARENWAKSGINTAGFWAKHLLWNKPGLAASIADIQRRFNVKIVRRR